MAITQTYEIPADRRITVPRELPTGATARVEFNIIPFVKKDEKPEAATSPIFRISRKELDEMVENCPDLKELTGILSGLGDITIEQIREERLAKYLK